VYFSCANGDEVGYGAANSCGSVDVDNGSGNVNDVRGDGSIGQTENISLGEAVEGHTYNGRVHYYSGDVDTQFRIIISRPILDADGNWNG
jgi:hypothetical protein